MERELVDVDAWLAASAERQLAILEGLAARSGRELRALRTEAEPRRMTTGGPRLLHRRSGLRFCLVPGGTSTLGPPERPRVASLPPYLLAEEPLSPADAARLLGHPLSPARLTIVHDPPPAYLFPDEIDKIMVAPLRLPFDSEWEAAYRAGTTTPFFWGDIIPDAPPALAHPLGLALMGFYDEAQADGWVRGGAARLWPWRGGHEWERLLSAIRVPRGARGEPLELAVRLAMSYPSERSALA
ncbi:MAG: hypothetical protein U1F43_08955 [Myxococcota bacterium]